jgi:hypothetical protein
MLSVQIAFTKQLALGLGACILVMGSFIATWFTFPHPLINPALFIPADETVAFFEHITKENHAFFARAFPLLTEVPLTEADASVAFVKINDERIAWILLEPNAGDSQPFRIRTSSPQASALLTDIEHPLSRDYTFSVLHKDPQDRGPSAFIRFPRLTIDSASPLGALLRPDRPTSITQTVDGLRIRFLTSNTDKDFSALEHGPKDIFPHPLFIMQASNLSETLHLSQSILQPTPVLISKTILRQAIASLFGTDISPAYDIAPLLTGPTSLQAALDSDGVHIRFLLEGELMGESDTLWHLGDLFRAKLSVIAQESPTFDGKFTLPIVRHDSDLLEDTTKNENGWTVRTIVQKKNTSGLRIGLKNNTYLISNDADAFKNALISPAPALSSLEQAPFGLGIVQSKEAGNLLERTVPTIWPRTVLPSGTGGYLKWKMTQEGKRITVLFKKV